MKYIASVNSESCGDHKSSIWNFPLTCLVLDNFSLKAQSFANTSFSVSTNFIHYFLKVSQIPALKPFQIRGGSATPGRITDTPLQHEKGNDTNHNSETFHSRQALSTEQTLSSTLQIIWCLFAWSNTTTQRELQQQQKLQSAGTILRRQTGVFKSNTILRNIISPVKLPKGKNTVFIVCPSVCSSFQAVRKARPYSSSVSVGTGSLCPNPNPPTEEASQESLHQTHMPCTSNITSKGTN